ncbi:hypothetical protein D3C86_1509280 [compost metagenome]
MITAVISAPISRVMPMATMLAIYSWAPKACNWAAPTNARIRPTRLAISATIGSAPGPHCCSAAQKSPERMRARPCSRRPRARITAPVKAQALTSAACTCNPARPRRDTGPRRGGASSAT